MKKLLFTTAITCLSVIAFSQKISRVLITDKGASTTITVALDEGVIMNISQEGSLVEWGVNRYAERINDNIPRKLDEYTGRTEKYNESSDEAFRGKIRYIGKTQITYYASFDNKLLAGKIKSIGAFNIEYFDNYAETGSQGKIKSAGQTRFEYYSSFENEAVKNKIKTVGSTGITYYPSVEDKAYAGKVKSLGGTQYVYFSSHDQQGLKGALKSGNQIQVIGGITFWVR